MKTIDRVASLASVLGAVGIGAVALLGSPYKAEAASFACGPGPGWVSTCLAGEDRFPSIGQVFLDFDIDDGNFDGNADASVDLTGPTRIQRSNPINGGTTINTEIYSLNLKGNINGSSLNGVQLKVKAGDGNGNNQDDGPLHSPGQIIDANGDGFAASFFDIFAELSVPSLDLVARNMEPDAIHLDGVPDLIGVPPGIPGNVVDYVAPFGQITQFFLFDPETGEFVLDPNGNKILVAQLVTGPNGEPAETHTPTERIPRTPEPSSTISFAFAGLAAAWTLKKRQLTRKD